MADRRVDERLAGGAQALVVSTETPVPVNEPKNFVRAIRASSSCTHPCMRAGSLR